MDKVGILGAGLQGCCMALLFNKLGYDVTLIDQATDIMTRASANQEGKIHMGFVYSNDTSFETGKKMMLSALHFSHCIEYLLDYKINWGELKSTKFIYLVPHDSLVSNDKLEEYFNKLQDLYIKILTDEPYLSYLGEKPEKIFHKIPVPNDVDNTFFKYCFQTEEVAISQNVLKDHIKNTLISKGVKLNLNECILNVNRSSNIRFNVKTNKNIYQYEKVVNCLWENQRIIDQQLNVESKNENNLRLKFGIISKHIDELKTMPSMTIVNGPYGDYVNFQCHKDKKMYFSWYPISMYGMVVNQDVPNEWTMICKGDINNDLLEYQLKTQLNKFQQLFSRQFKFDSPKLIAGIIVATGKEDINYLESKLHQRNDNPIFYQDGYYSISTGKFTSAPYNTYLLIH